MGATASYAPAKEPSKLELKLGDVKQKELVVEDRLAEFSIRRFKTPIYLKDGTTEPLVDEHSPILYVARYKHDTEQAWARLLHGEKLERDSKLLGSDAEKQLSDPKKRAALEEWLKFGRYFVLDEIRLADDRYVIVVHPEKSKSGKKKLTLGAYPLRKGSRGWERDTSIDSTLFSRLYFRYPFAGPSKIIESEKGSAATPKPRSNEILSLPFGDAVVMSGRER